jgi:hypothetical protein
MLRTSVLHLLRPETPSIQTTPDGQLVSYVAKARTSAHSLLALRANGASLARRFVSLRLSNPFLATFRLFLVAALLFVAWIAAKAW